MISEDGVNGIYFIDEDWPLENHIAGFTFSANEKDVIHEVDIILNAQYFKWGTGDTIAADEMDIESILVHELGHALGLNHVGDKKAIMYTYAQKGVIARDVQPDDLTQLVYLYPPPPVEKPVVASVSPMAQLAEWFKGLF